MSFAHPLALLLGLLLIPVVLLYGMRVHLPTETIGTGPFWQKALAEEHARWKWRPRRSKFSLALQIMIVVLLTLAAMGPQFPAPRRIVLILDNSATMRATDVQPTRLDAAKMAARLLIGNLRSCDAMAVVATSPVPYDLQPMTSNRDPLVESVESVQATADKVDLEWAVKLAREVGTPDERPTSVMLISDCCFKDAAKRVQESGAEILRVGTTAGNVTIAAFTARRSRFLSSLAQAAQGPEAKKGAAKSGYASTTGDNPHHCQVLIEVANLANQPTEGRVALSIDRKPTEPVVFSISKNGRWQHVFDLDIASAARLEAKLEPVDAYPFDNGAALDIPAAPASHRVRLVSDLPSCLHEVLAANRRVDIVKDDDAKTIQVLDGHTPEKLPDGPLLLFTPSACDLWQLGEPLVDPTVSHCDEASPVTVGVRLWDAYLPDARRLKFAPAIQDVVRPLFYSDKDAPLAYAIDRPQGRIVVVCGNLATSNLGRQADFAAFVDRALDWLTGRAVWRDEVISSALPYAGEGPEALSPADADLRVPMEIGSDASTIVSLKAWPPLWIVPALLALVLLVIEWCLYHRRWTT